MNEQEVRQAIAHHIFAGDYYSLRGADKEDTDSLVASLKSLEPKVDEIEQVIVEWDCLRKTLKTIKRNEIKELATAIIDYLKRR